MKEPITKELRELPLYSSVKAATTDTIDLIEPLVYVTMADLDAIADRIDAEHQHRLMDCRRNTKRELVRYLRGVLTDYDRNIRRVRKGDKAEVVRCKDCQYAREMDDRHVCAVRPLMAHLVDGSDYCSRGKRKEVETQEAPMSEAAQRVFDRLVDASAGKTEDGANG